MDYAKKAEEIRRELSRSWMLAANGHVHLSRNAKARGQGITAMAEALNGTFCALRAINVGKPRPLFPIQHFKKGGSSLVHQVGRAHREPIMPAKLKKNPWND